MFLVLFELEMKNIYSRGKKNDLDKKYVIIYLQRNTSKFVDEKVKNVTRFSSKGTCQILQKKDKSFVDQPFDLFFRK